MAEETTTNNNNNSSSDNANTTGNQPTVFLCPTRTHDEEEEVEEEMVNNNDSNSNPWLKEQPTQETGGPCQDTENPWDVSPAVTVSQSELSALSNLEPTQNNTPGTNSTTPPTAVEEAAAIPLPAAPTLEGDLLQMQDNNTSSSQAADHPLQPNIPQSMSQLSTPNPIGQAVSYPVPSTAETPTVPQSLTQVNSNAGYMNSLHNIAEQQPSINLTIDTKVNNNNLVSSQDEDGSEYMEGGRLWKAALKEAEKQGKKPPKRSKFAETMMERTRSRADPNALVSPNSSVIPGGKPSMITLGDNDGAFILSTALAKKRVRVVQLLLIGLVGLLLGLLGNFFVSTSCHFATVNIVVGQNEKTFGFHFGLWKYSPIESVFQGYPYCVKYDQDYANDAPIVSRTTNIVALVAGLIAMSILWLYLIFGSTNKRRWKWAVRIAVVAGLVQLSTLYFFVGTVCQEYSCEFGPGAYLSVFTSVVWFVLACEMHYHMPVATYATGGGGTEGNLNIGALEEPRALVGTMEMTHVDEVAREYITRVTGKTKEDEMPGLNTDLKRVRPRSNLYSPSLNASMSTTKGNGNSFYLPSPRGTYQAPDPAILEETL